MAEIHDLCDCQLKTEEELVKVFQKLYHKQQSYVRAGDVLVSTNSWKDGENLENEITNFIELAKLSREALPPHAFAVAENALENARKGHVAIIPVGESGSGKSRNVEIILDYLAQRSLSQKQFSKETILAINSIIDSFCNAKTLICNNSTRCLKFYEIFLDDNTDDVVGVHLQICFLEKLRVVSRINNEGTFHIFHQFLNGLTSEQLNKYFLHGNHRYVPGNREQFVEIDEDSPLDKIIMCLKKLGFIQEEIHCIYALLSAIILLGDLEFGQSKKRGVPAVVNVDVFERVAVLLGVPSSSLLSFIVVQSKRSKELSSANAMYQRDCLAAVLYETLVMWIESRINRKYSKSSQCSIFLLDAFGWENYNLNFFEQLCINITNETLQCSYNNIIFRQHQMELEQENIFLDKSFKEYDQPGSMPFFFKYQGLLDVLDITTESKEKMNDHTLLKKMNSAFKNDSCYAIANDSKFNGFIIQHFIGEVTYDVNGFLAKSLHWMNTDLLACLKGSKNKVVSLMVQERLSRENFSLDRDASSRNASLKRLSLHENEWFKTDVFLSLRQKKKKFVTCKSSNPSILTMTLTSLLRRLSSSKVYFIRCIKMKNMAGNHFDYERVLHQVKWSALLPTIQSRASFLKMKFTFSEFISRYKIIFFHLSRSIEPSSEVCSSILHKSYDDSQFRIGKTKVFMSSSLVFELEKKLTKIFSQILLIQKVFRGKLGRNKFDELKKLKNKYDIERSTFYSQLSTGNIQFHDHLSLQIMEDQRRLKNSRLQEEQKKSQRRVTSPTKSNPKIGRSTSYILDDKIFNDMISEQLTWCKVICFQRANQLAEFDVQEPKVVIDGTNHVFTTSRIGFNSFPTPSQDKQMTKVKECIGRGVQLSLTKDGSLVAIRLCKNPIFVKGHYCEEMLVETLGELEKNKETKVFDFDRFVESVDYECNPGRVEFDTEDDCLATCVLSICFVKNSDDDENCPCWVEIVLTKAMDYVQKSISFALDRRRIVQEKLHYKQPPKLRDESKIESVSEKALKMIRPSRYIETVKFKRKAWARKRVESNPFLYGSNASTAKSPDGKIPRSKSTSATGMFRPVNIERSVGVIEHNSSSPEIPSPSNTSVVRAMPHQSPSTEGKNQVSPEHSYSSERSLSLSSTPLSLTLSDEGERTYLSPGLNDSNASTRESSLMQGTKDVRSPPEILNQDYTKRSSSISSPRTSEPSGSCYSPQNDAFSRSTPDKFQFDEKRFSNHGEVLHTEKQPFQSPELQANQQQPGFHHQVVSAPSAGRYDNQQAEFRHQDVTNPSAGQYNNQQREFRHPGVTNPSAGQYNQQPKIHHQGVTNPSAGQYNQQPKIHHQGVTNPSAGQYNQQAKLHHPGVTNPSAGQYNNQQREFRHPGVTNPSAGQYNNQQREFRHPGVTNPSAGQYNNQQREFRHPGVTNPSAGQYNQQPKIHQQGVTNPSAGQYNNQQREFRHPGVTNPSAGQYNQQPKLHHQGVTNPSAGQYNQQPKLHHPGVTNPSAGQYNQQPTFHHQGVTNPSAGQYNQQPKLHHPGVTNPSAGQYNQQPTFHHQGVTNPSAGQYNQQPKLHHQGVTNPSAGQYNNQQPKFDHQGVTNPSPRQHNNQRPEFRHQVMPTPSAGQHNYQQQRTAQRPITPHSSSTLQFPAPGHDGLTRSFQHQMSFPR